MCITNLYRQKFEKEIRCPSWESGVWGACGAGDTCVSEGRGGFVNDHIDNKLLTKKWVSLARFMFLCFRPWVFLILGVW